MSKTFDIISIYLTCCACMCYGNPALTNPCDAKDLDCLGASTVNFIEQTSKGIPQYNIKATDPMEHPLIVVNFDKDGVTEKYTNLTVTGMKNLRLEDFTMNLDYGAVVLKTNVDLKFSGQFEADYKPEDKQFTGPIAVTGQALTVAKYFYNTVFDDKGVAHFDVGPEIIECTAKNVPTFQYNEEMMKAITNDADVKDERKGILSNDETKKAAFCSLVKAVYPTVVHNIRAAAKVLPKAAFIKNV